MRWQAAWPGLTFARPAVSIPFCFSSNRRPSQVRLAQRGIDY
jgi:hypothetical protein